MFMSTTKPRGGSRRSALRTSAGFRISVPVYRRFLQPDPLGYDDGMNIYAYVGNDPVNFTDPSGLSMSDCLAARAAAIKEGGDAAGVVCGSKGGGGGGGFFFRGGSGTGGSAGGVGRGGRGGGPARAPGAGAKEKPNTKKEPENACQSLGNRVGNALEYGGQGVSYSGLVIAGIGAPAGPVGAAPGLVIAGVGGILSSLGQVSQDIAFGRSSGEITGRFLVNALGARVLNNVVPSSLRNDLGDAIFGQTIGDIASATNDQLDPDRC